MEKWAASRMLNNAVEVWSNARSVFVKEAVTMGQMRRANQLGMSNVNYIRRNLFSRPDQPGYTFARGKNTEGLLDNGPMGIMPLTEKSVFEMARNVAPTKALKSTRLDGVYDANVEGLRQFLYEQQSRVNAGSLAPMGSRGAGVYKKGFEPLQGQRPLLPESQRQGTVYNGGDLVNWIRRTKPTSDPHWNRPDFAKGWTPADREAFNRITIQHELTEASPKLHFNRVGFERPGLYTHMSTRPPLQDANIANKWEGPGADGARAYLSIRRPEIEDLSHQFQGVAPSNHGNRPFKFMSDIEKGISPPPTVLDDTRLSRHVLDDNARLSNKAIRNIERRREEAEIGWMGRKIQRDVKELDDYNIWDRVVYEPSKRQIKQYRKTYGVDPTTSNVPEGSFRWSDLSADQRRDLSMMRPYSNHPQAAVRRAQLAPPEGR